MRDTSAVDSLLSEWFDWKPTSGRLESIQRGIGKRELLVAEADNKIIGFIHYVIHEDLIDGGPNSSYQRSTFPNLIGELESELFS